jgi:hypothetical protein
MKKAYTYRMLAIALLIIGTAVFQPSCAPSQRTVDQQRKGLMIQDKAEYSRNKKFKKSKSYRKQKRRYKRYKSKPVRR